jgi:hypothetical protein
MLYTIAKTRARGAALMTLLCAGVGLSACTTMGTGTGSITPGNAPVNFAWKSTDGGNSGTMSATLAGGTAFSGPYLQVTSDVRRIDFDPLWSGWDYGWSDWDFGQAFPQDAFATLYSDRVMANLQAADGQRMRCRFLLNHPLDGMSGGGQGQCQLDNGRSVDAVFPAV